MENIKGISNYEYNNFIKNDNKNYKISGLEALDIITNYFKEGDGFKQIFKKETDAIYKDLIMFEELKKKFNIKD